MTKMSTTKSEKDCYLQASELIRRIATEAKGGNPDCINYIDCLASAAIKHLHRLSEQQPEAFNHYIAKKSKIPTFYTVDKREAAELSAFHKSLPLTEKFLFKYKANKGQDPVFYIIENVVNEVMTLKSLKKQEKRLLEKGLDFPPQYYSDELYDLIWSLTDINKESSDSWAEVLAKMLAEGNHCSDEYGSKSREFSESDIKIMQDASRSYRKKTDSTESPSSWKYGYKRKIVEKFKSMLSK